MTTNPRTRKAPVRGAKKPLRFKFGIALLILYPLFFLIIPIAPFLPIDAGSKVGLVAGVLAAGEGVLLLAIACVGKEAFQAIKAKILRRKKKPVEEATETTTDAPTAKPAVVGGVRQARHAG
ncbi:MULTISPECIES: transporter suffix domain-containing protein [unclassified Brevibacterium]|uniref:transporter suffix domain-containing protein n=1 Tax=unclassified Brevibacterium TaxID=2614124 RepID=UPI0010F69AB3|nr:MULTISPECIES: transporter suffix domain-containing protein [unclassified Brevibacterium]MCM1011946.1 transporter suffix domain-containing protein [Brevibacterium sp. XM4083]